jgi:GAF domain-containing protein
VKTFHDIQQNALKMLHTGADRKKILAYIAKEGQKLMGKGAAVSILLVENGVLRNGASPALPADYLQAIDGIRPDPNVGTCAAAAATGNFVVTPDFRADDKWAELRHLPLSIGYAGACSMPIKRKDGTVLGTFGTYFRESRHPSPDEITGIELLATTASSVIVDAKDAA